MGPGRRPQGRRRRSSPRPTARWRSRRSRTRPSPPAGPATCWPGRSARSWPRASQPFDAARLGVYLHGLAGDVGARAVRRRRAPRLRPARRARARPEAPVRGRRAPQGARASRVRRASGRAARTDVEAASPPAPAAPADADTPDRREAADRGAPGRGGAAAAAADGLARDRPRRPGRQPGRAARGWPGRTCPCSRSSRPTPTATGRSPVARALVAAGADGLCVATLDEAFALRAAGIAAPILVLYPVPPAWASPRPRAPGSPSARATGPARRRCSRPSAALPRGAPPALARSSSRSRPGSGAAASPLDGRSSRRARRIAARPASRLAGALDAPPGARGRATGPSPRSPASRRAAAALAAAGDRRAAPARSRRAPGSCSGTSPRYDGVRPGPRTLRARARRAATRTAGTGDRRAAPTGPVAPRPARPRRGPPGRPGISYGPTFTTERPSRIATLPLGYGDGWPRSLSNRAEALVRGAPRPARRQRGDGRGHGRRHGRPGPPVDDRRRVRAHRRPGRRRITAARSGAAAHHELVGGRAPRWPGGSSGVPCLGRTGGDPDARPAEDSWLESNSGTATSATSRSTRS